MAYGRGYGCIAIKFSRTVCERVVACVSVIVAANGMACHASSATETAAFMVRYVYALCSRQFLSVYTHTQTRAPTPP